MADAASTGTKQSRRRVEAVKAKAQAKKEDASARMLQCAWKSKQSRRKVTAMRAEKERLMEEASASMLQCAWKSKCARRKCGALKAKKEAALELAAALMLQSAWRCKKARRHLGGKRHGKGKQQAAAGLQAAFRSRAARLHVHDVSLGTLRLWSITVVSAEGLKPVDVSGKADPFCTIGRFTLAHIMRTSRPHTDADR
jgi:hypothetical protein